jgi:hypothetical protein
MTARKPMDLPKHLALQAMRDADEAIAAKHRQGVFDEGDPNHPRYNNGINYVTGKPISIFGYDTDSFMSRQHR